MRNDIIVKLIESTKQARAIDRSELLLQAAKEIKRLRRLLKKLTV